MPALIRGIVGIEQLTGRQREAKARLEAALDSLGERALRSRGLPEDRALDERYLPGPARGDVRVGQARGRGCQGSRLTAPERRPRCSALTLGAAFTGRLEIALECADTAADLIDSLSDEELAKGIDAIGSLAGAELYLDRYESSRDHSDRGLRVARASGQGELVAMISPALGTSLWVLGELDRGVEVLGRPSSRQGSQGTRRRSRGPRSTAPTPR